MVVDESLSISSVSGIDHIYTVDTDTANSEEIFFSKVSVLFEECVALHRPAGGCPIRWHNHLAGHPVQPRSSGRLA